MAWHSISTALLLALITQTQSQFFDFFNFQPTSMFQPLQSTKIFGNDHTTRKSKVDVVKINPNPQMTWRNTTVSFNYDGIEREERPRQSGREKKRRQPAIPAVPTLLPIFNYYTSTPKTSKKTTKVNRNNSTNNNRQSVHKKNTNRQQLSSQDVDVSKNTQISDWYDRPINNVADTDNNHNFNKGPPITNKPVTQRPYRPETQRPYRPETQRPYETERPRRPATSKPTTVKPYIVNSIPTQAGAVVFPHEDEPPEIIKGADEDYMSETEKRRYIELAEKMCDKYKSLNTKQLAAIPLLPSPEPVSVNISQCAPNQIPLVVGGKVVTINEFPHMALLGWVKIDGGGYSWKCGGSLISDQFVLTAAHCSYEERDNTVITGPPRVVQLGSSYLDDPGALVVRVAAVIRHPKYKFPRSYYDLALLKLVQPVTFSEVIKPACLGVPPPVDQPIIATGWGKTEFGGDQSLELRSVSLPVWNMDKCRDILGTSRKMPQGALADSQLCAGEKRGGKDTCQGDSGGPAQLQDGCAWRVVAVTSLGRSCGAPNTPGLYALVQRAFVAAAVFGNLKNNQRRSNNGTSNSNGQNSNSYGHNSNNYDYTTTTTQGYKSNRRTTTTEAYYNYNHQQNNNQHSNRRTTTTTESYYNPQQYDNGYQSNRRRTTTTTTTEVYYNRPQNGYNQNYPRQDADDNNERKNSQNTRDVDTESYYNQQRDPNYNRDYNNQQSDYNNRQSDYNNRQNDYSNRQNDNNNRQNGYWSNNNRRNDDRYEPGAIWFT
ncbi:trypsin domain-containing protein [Phthorimaea operculella]|nr:trypsin domain-containing protein [Phthorimaea operculella]